MSNPMHWENPLPLQDWGLAFVAILDVASELNYIQPWRIVLTDQHGTISFVYDMKDAGHKKNIPPTGEFVSPCYYLLIDALGRSVAGRIEDRGYSYEYLNTGGLTRYSPTSRMSALSYSMTPERTAELKAMPYVEFLNTAYWKAVAAYVRKRDGKCMQCGTTKSLYVHHKTYAHRGEEVFYLEDLITLCQLCHAEIHGE